MPRPRASRTRDMTCGGWSRSPRDPSPGRAGLSGSGQTCGRRITSESSACRGESEPPACPSSRGLLRSLAGDKRAREDSPQAPGAGEGVLASPDPESGPDGEVGRVPAGRGPPLPALLRFSAAGLLPCRVTARSRGLHRLIILLPHPIKVLQVPESQGRRDLQLIYTRNPTAEEPEMPCLGRAQGHGANPRKHLSGGSTGCFMVSTRLINPTTPFLRCEE